jgi:hypothetical protein
MHIGVVVLDNRGPTLVAQHPTIEKVLKPKICHRSYDIHETC